MLILLRSQIKIQNQCKIKQLRRFFCDITLKRTFTEEEVRKILHTVNTSSLEELSRFSITKSRVEKIIGWRNENKQFRKLPEILELDDFGEKIFEKFCQSILNENKKEQSPKQNISRMVSPKLSEEARQRISSCCSVHIGVDNITWCRLALQGEGRPSIVTHWQQMKFNSRKTNVMDLVEIILEVNEQIPDCDAYILESPVSRPPTLSSSKTEIRVNTEQSQILAMITLILSQRENSSVFFLRAYLAARLFGTLVGSERVSAHTTVSHLLEDSLPKSFNEDIRGKIICPEDVLTHYKIADGAVKEFLGRSLMLSLGFLRLCLIKCSTSLAAINNK